MKISDLGPIILKNTGDSLQYAPVKAALRFRENWIMIFVIMAVMIIQCVVLFYWEGQRGNYYIDEFYSFEYANTFSEEITERINTDPEFGHDKWIDVDVFASRMEVGDEESLWEMKPGEALRLLLSKRTYMGLLNMAMAKTEPFEGYTQGALVLNIIILLITEILIALVIKGMTGNSTAAVACVIMFGFSGFTMALTEYIRFYVMAMLLLMIVVYCHMKMWHMEKGRYFLILELIAFFCAYLGIWHSELILVICGTMFCLYFVGLLLRGRFKNAVIYAVPLLYGLMKYVDGRTDLLRMVLHPADFAEEGTHGKGMVAYNLITVTPERAQECMIVIRDCITTMWFGYGFLAIADLALIVILLIMVIVTYKKRKAAGWLKWQNNYGIYAIILILTAVSGFIFNVLTNIAHYRYNSFFMLLSILVLWYIIGILYRRFPKKSIMAIFVAFTIAGAVTCQQIDRFPQMFPEDKEAVTAIKEYNDLDNILFGKMKESNYKTGKEMHSLYDCVIHAGSDTRVLLIDPFDTKPIEEIDPPKRFLAWCYRHGQDRLEADIAGTGYKVKKIGTTHYNDVYLVER